MRGPALKALPACLAMLALWGWAGPAASQEEPSPVGVEVTRLPGGARLVEAVLPGELLAVAAPRKGAARRLFLLVAPEGGVTPEDDGKARALYELDPAGQLRLLRDDLWPETNALAAIPSRDGKEELLLGRPGSFEKLILGDGVMGDGVTSLQTIFHHDFLELASRPAAAVSLSRDSADETTLALVETGALGLYRPAPDDVLELVDELPLPITTRRGPRSLVLATPPVTELARPGRGALYACGPLAEGRSRLRTVLLDPEAAGEGRSVDSWAQLPGPEAVTSSWYGWLGETPVLVVATFRADKLGIFERAGLRLFRLGADRTRAGRRPALVAETTSRRWQRLEPRILDFDADGHEDLVVLQQDGLGGKELVVELFPGRAGGRLESRSRKTKLEAPTQRWHFGDDLTGDGVADLVYVADGELAIHEGLPNDRRQVVAKKPTWQAPLGEDEDAEVRVEITVGSRSRVEGVRDSRGLGVADLDGDGRGEILLAGGVRQGRSVLRLVLMAPAPESGSPAPKPAAD